jgi:hypothetical protein
MMASELVASMTEDVEAVVELTDFGESDNRFWGDASRGLEGEELGTASIAATTDYECL